jgi:hypothetical protein
MEVAVLESAFEHIIFRGKFALSVEMTVFEIALVYLPVF